MGPPARLPLTPPPWCAGGFSRRKLGQPNLLAKVAMLGLSLLVAYVAFSCHMKILKIHG